MKDEFKYLLALSTVPGIGNATLKLLLSHFEFAEDICRASAEALLAVPGLNHKCVPEIIKARNQQHFEVEVQVDLPPQTEIITYTSERYPQLLKTIYDPPPFLFVRGNCQLLEELSFAVVGTRRPTIYGQKVATKLAQELAVAGFTIVSGLAEGIDAAAHRASLEIGGTTVAVLGCGVDVVYPAINVGLYDEIFAKGLLVSEFLPGTKPTKYSFPKRNRIISGLSKGVLFVEGGRKSGAMITVDYALEQGRDVFAVPGKIDNPQAAGTNWIIQHGAKLVQEVNDILEEYNMATPAVEARETSLLEKLNLQQLDEDSRRIVGALIEGEQNIELLSRLLDMDVITLQAKLTQLELKGVVKRRSGKVFGLG